MSIRHRPNPKLSVISFVEDMFIIASIHMKIASSRTSGVEDLAVAQAGFDQARR